MRNQKTLKGRRARHQCLERMADQRVPRPRRPSSGKTCFNSESEADVALRRIANEPARDGDRPQRAYDCEACGCWHLTKMPKAQP